ncbi:uncharacterized protein LOC129900030 [Solanum dulcamara]|uniref:uncharacterized protein LOC129900030 n=1 Tax=Solanum dulcamara TaxID=45834 RepID=UPI002486187F|nr:uncharacterized protein LOC129900030 [Solanum dulcamara]
MQFQMKLQTNPKDYFMIEKEIEISKEYVQLKEAREQFLKQKAKVQWLQEGDHNTKFYHSYMKARRNNNRVFVIRDKDGVQQTGMKAINNAFLSYYAEMLGQANKGRQHVSNEIIKRGSVVTEAQRTQLEMVFTEKEVKEAMWGIDGNKSPGPDGYGSQFFKDNWDIVGNDAVKGVMDFFSTGKLHKGINSTTITLIPKGTHAEAVGDYMSISCCNVIYKTISKMLC